MTELICELGRDVGVNLVETFVRMLYHSGQRVCACRQKGRID